MRIFKSIRSRMEESKDKTVSTSKKEGLLLYSHIVLSQDATIIQLSNEFVTLSGHDSSVLKNKSVEHFFTAYSFHQIQRLLHTLTDHHPFDSLEVVLESKNKESIRLEATFTLFYKEGEKQYFTILKNIDPERKVMDALTTQKDHFKCLAENTSYIQVLFDDGMNCQFISPSVIETLGYPVEFWKVSNFYNLVHPEDVNQLWDCINNNELQDLNSIYFRLKHLSGKYISVDCHIRKIMDEFGTPEYFVFNLHDAFNQKQYEQELIKAKKEALAAVEVKNNFLTSISHELRTPLNAIIGFSNILTAHNTDPQYKSYAEQIHTNGAQLLEMIDRILDYTNVEKLVNQPNFSSVNLPNFFMTLRNHTRAHRELSNKTDIEVTGNWEIKDQYDSMVTDELLLKKIMLNLIDNALKFTKSGFINYGCRPYGIHQYLFYVEDSGIGISTKDQTLVFERFRQLDQSTSREFGGVGIGLSLSKKLVEILGGELWMISEENKGTAIYFNLPIEVVQETTYE